MSGLVNYMKWKNADHTKPQSDADDDVLEYDDPAIGALLPGVFVDGDLRELVVRLSTDSSQFDAGIRKSKKTVNSFVGNLKKSAKGLAALAGGFTLADSIGSAIRANTQFGKSLSELKAITGATGKDLAFLAKSSQDLARTTGIAGSEILQGFKLVASAKPELLESVDALKAVTAEVLTLSKAANLDLATAAKSVGESLNQFKAGAQDASRFVNVLAAGAKFGASEVQDTAAAILEAGTAARLAGLSFEDANAAIQVLAENGIKSTKAGNQLKNILIILESQADDKLKPSLVGLGQALTNLGDKQLSAAEASKFFGRESLAAGVILGESADRLDHFKNSVTGSNVAMEQARAQMNNLAGDTDKLSASFNALQTNLGSKLNGELRGAVQALTDLLNASQAVNAEFEFQQPLTTKTGDGIKALALRYEFANDEAKKFFGRLRQAKGLFDASGAAFKGAFRLEDNTIFSQAGRQQVSGFFTHVNKEYADFYTAVEQQAKAFEDVTLFGVDSISPAAGHFKKEIADLLDDLKLLQTQRKFSLIESFDAEEAEKALGKIRTIIGNLPLNAKALKFAEGLESQLRVMVSGFNKAAVEAKKLDEALAILSADRTLKLDASALKEFGTLRDKNQNASQELRDTLSRDIELIKAVTAKFPELAGDTNELIKTISRKTRDELKRLSALELAPIELEVRIRKEGVEQGLSDSETQARVELLEFFQATQEAVKTQEEKIREGMKRTEKILLQVIAKFPQFADEAKKLIEKSNKQTGEEIEALRSKTEKETSQMSVFADQAARNMQDAFADFLFDPFDKGIKGMLQAFADAIRRMIAQAAAAKVFETVFGSSGSGSSGSGAIGAGISALFGGTAATGSEGATPLVAGNGSKSASVQINNSYDFSGADSSVVAKVPQMIEESAQRTRAEIFEAIQNRTVS